SGEAGTMLKKRPDAPGSKNDCILNRISLTMMMILHKLTLCLILFGGSHCISTQRYRDTMENEILKYVNEDRISHGLSPLQLNSTESALASKHSQNMAAGKVKFGHDGFNSRAKAIQKALGSIEIGENVASGTMTAREVVDGWLHSPGHKKNIEGNFVFTGIGYAPDKKGNIYFTQIFSR
ncbi:MAG TPA: CAP domain-containing protein, partial [Puia sp.]